MSLRTVMLKSFNSIREFKDRTKFIISMIINEILIENANTKNEFKNIFTTMWFSFIPI